MPIVTGNFASLLTPGFRKIWGDTYDTYEEEFSKVFEVSSESQRNYVEDHSITSLGQFAVKNQVNSISYDTIYDGFTKRYTFVTFGLGFSVSREMVEDDLYRKMKNMPKALAISARESREVLAANVLNRAFTAGYTGGDGVVLGSDSHPLYGGGTFSNMPSIATDLDITSYEQALIDIQMNFVDDRGKKIKVLPKSLVIHPSNLFQAQMLLKSAQLPDTANNNYNPAQGTMPGGIVVMHYLTDSDAWFIKTNCSNGLNFINRRAVEFTQDNDFDSENAKFKSTYRCDVGWTDPRGLYCNAGG